MNGVSKITCAEDIMLISIADADAQTMVDTLAKLAAAGVVVDMISQTAPMGSHIRFSFTAPFSFFDVAIQALGAQGKADGISPMVSGGYCKINMFGKEMVDSVGVAARALSALKDANIDIALITTSDLDISVLIRQEDEDIAIKQLNATFGL